MMSGPIKRGVKLTAPLAIPIQKIWHLANYIRAILVPARYDRATGLASLSRFLFDLPGILVNYLI